MRILHDPIARMRLRVHWAPGIPRALCYQKGESVGNSRALRAAEFRSMSDVARAWTAFSTVIVRGRSSIAETSVIESINRGVLEARMRVA